MNELYLAFAAAGATGGIAVAWLASRRLIDRISEDTAHARQTRLAGTIAGLTAVPPALFIATVLGGNLGGTIAAGLGARLSMADGVRQIVTGVGIGCGILAVLALLVTCMAGAGAVFVKVFLARGRVHGS